MDRRKFLANGTVAATSIFGVGIGSADRSRGRQKDLDKVYERALEERKESGDNEEFERILRESQFNVTTRKDQINVASQQSEDEDVSTQKWHQDSGSLDVNLFIFGGNSGSNEFIVDFAWNFHDYADTLPREYGVDPHDVAALYWSTEHYSRIKGTYQTSEYVLLDEDHGDKSNVEGLAVEYEDEAQFDDEVDPGNVEYPPLSSFFSTKVERKPNNGYSPSAEVIGASYTHTYRGGEVNGVTIDENGPAINYSWQVKDWEKTYEISGDDIRY